MVVISCIFTHIRTSHAALAAIALLFAGIATPMDRAQMAAQAAAAAEARLDAQRQRGMGQHAQAQAPALAAGQVGPGPADFAISDEELALQAEVMAQIEAAQAERQRQNQEVSDAAIAQQIFQGETDCELARQLQEEFDGGGDGAAPALPRAPRHPAAAAPRQLAPAPQPKTAPRLAAQAKRVVAAARPVPAPKPKIAPRQPAAAPRPKTAPRRIAPQGKVAARRPAPAPAPRPKVALAPRPKTVQRPKPQGKVTPPQRRPATAPQRPAQPAQQQVLPAAVAGVHIVALRSTRQEGGPRCGAYALCNMAAIAQCVRGNQAISPDSVQTLCRQLVGRCPATPRGGFSNDELFGDDGCVADRVGLDNVFIAGRDPLSRQLFIDSIRSSGRWFARHADVGQDGSPLERRTQELLRQRVPLHFFISTGGHWVAASAVPAANSWTIYYLDTGRMVPSGEAQNALNLIQNIFRRG